jgi:hypothetical protein
MLKAKTLIITCTYAPSQWEGITEDGKSFYIRCRWGNLILNISEKESTNVDDAIKGITVFQKNISDKYDDLLNIQDIKEILSEIIDLSIKETLNEISF